MVVHKFVDPVTKQLLVTSSNGDLMGDGSAYRRNDGVYDFVPEGTQLWKEREYYDRHYGRRKLFALSREQLETEWNSEIYPEYKTLLDSLGELKGKRILCLGNGESRKEFHFLVKGAEVVLTDLSLEAMKHKKRELEASDLYAEYGNKIEFYAVDALHLPFIDGEFDLVYGAAFVHHIPEQMKYSLFAEIRRCLNDYGKCRFLDQAASSAWDLIKKMALPLKEYSYHMQPRSPEDLSSTWSFTKESILELQKSVGFRELYWHREWFFLRIVNRHLGKLVNWDTKRIRRARFLYLLCKVVDNKLKRTQWMQRNALMLTWGFDK